MQLHVCEEIASLIASSLSVSYPISLHSVMLKLLLLLSSLGYWMALQTSIAIRESIACYHLYVSRVIAGTCMKKQTISYVVNIMEKTRSIEQRNFALLALLNSTPVKKRSKSFPIKGLLLFFPLCTHNSHSVFHQ